jgi:death-on-curing protein
MTNLEYPTSDDIHDIHDAVVAGDLDTEPGIKSGGDIDFAVSYIKEGYYGEVPEGIHEKAAHLMRLIASGHAYTDGNKRTALESVELFYNLNGYRFEYGHEVEDTLEDFATNADLVDMDAVASYLDNHTTAAQST